MRAVRIIKPRDEIITFVVTEPANMSLADVEDVPGIGKHWTEPAPIRSVESEHRWLPLLYVAAGVIAVVASTLAPYWVQP